MFRGSYTMMVTPFDGTGEVDEAALRRFVDWQIAEGADGLIPLGSTGEFLSQTRAERERVAAVVVERSAGRVPVIVGAAAEWTKEAVDYARDAERVGADAVMIVPPFYSSPSPDELFAHYKAIASAIGIPVMIYNNPFTSNTDITPAIVARLAEIDNVRYIKESSGDVTRVTKIGAACGDRMTVFAGYHPWESFRCGATGYTSVFANILPKLSHDLFTLAVDEDDFSNSLALYRKVMPLLDAIAGDLYVAATKAALELVGHPAGAPRPPRLPLPEAKRAHLRKVLGDLGVLARKAA
jgi:4-hydroxy-tetrahydrodipicolinate synthase